ncbi:MAG: hypothetical protein V1765_01190 [bacterium]
MLSLGILFTWQTAQAGCGTLNTSIKPPYGECTGGDTPGGTYWNGSAKRWEWTCNLLLCNAPGVCGNNVVDPGLSEECDGTDLVDKQCKDIPGYSGGTLSCSSCKFNVSACIEDITCGNGTIDEGEECEINPLNLNGQTCASLKKGTGTLGCNPATCTFDVKQCRFCGNDKAEDNEQCDGGDLKGATCQSLGLGDGALACANCQYLTDDCSGSQGVCFNGILEKGEECEWPDQFRNNATCESLGCGKGYLACNGFICKNDTSGCEDPTCSQDVSNLPCANPLWSNWAKNPFVKPCPSCGLANDRSFDVLPTNVYDLCKNTKQPSVTVYDWYSRDYTPQLFQGWQWYCGKQLCHAWVKPRCRTDLAEPNTCTASGIGLYLTEAAYNTQKNKKSGSVNLCDRGRPTADSASDGECRTITGDQYYSQFNTSWYCVSEKPDVADMVRCAVSWGQAGTCGTENGKEYATSFYGCDKSEFWDVINKAEKPYLCGSSSILVFNSLRYVNIGHSDMHLTWQCQWQDSESKRLGGVVACRTNAKGSCYTHQVNGKCGYFTKTEFPRSDYPLPGPYYIENGDMCALGTPEPYEAVYNTSTSTWTWTCKGEGKDATNATCSVQAAAVCGTAHRGSYLTEAALRQANLCAKGELKFNRVYSEGSTWYWYCAGKGKAAFVRCVASKCGSAANGDFTQPTFDGRKSASSFLCGANGQATDPGNPVYNMSLRKSQWTWDCDYGDSGYIKGCQATEMKCGFAHTNLYLNNSFQTIHSFYYRQANWATFLCTGGQITNLVQPSKSNNWRWTWNCQGTTGETLTGGCYAEAYHCGDYDGQVLAESTFTKHWNDLNYNNKFCSHDSVKSLPWGNNGSWQCSTPAKDGDPSYSAAQCSYTKLTCGSANNSVYTASTLTSNINQNNGFLCASGGTAKEITCFAGTCRWYCNDNYGGSSSLCSAVELTCGRAHDTSMFDWVLQLSTTKLCSSGSQETAIMPSRKIIEQNRLVAKSATWQWQCQDTKGGLSTTCSATCVGSGQYCNPIE